MRPVRLSLSRASDWPLDVWLALQIFFKKNIFLSSSCHYSIGFIPSHPPYRREYPPLYLVLGLRVYVCMTVCVCVRSSPLNRTSACNVEELLSVMNNLSFWYFVVGSTFFAGHFASELCHQAVSNFQRCLQAQKHWGALLYGLSNKDISFQFHLQR